MSRGKKIAKENINTEQAAVTNQCMALSLG